MRKLLILCCVLFPISAHAQHRETMNEYEQMGLLAGLAAACDIDAHVMHDYEEIASRIIANKSPSQSVEEMFLKNYATAKKNFYVQQKKSPEVDCGEIIANFTKMPLFRFTLFDDGSLITNEGQYLLPRGQKNFNPKAQQVYPATNTAAYKNAANRPAQVSKTATLPAATTKPASAQKPKTASYNKNQPVRNPVRPVRGSYD